MGRITHRLHHLLKQFQQWEITSQIGFILAILFAVVAGLVASRGDEALRDPATVGAIGSIITAQVIFMWANRNMVTPYTRAQRHYMRGEFETARDLLAKFHQREEADFKMLTLLGNTYRQLGDLNNSEQVLYEALNMQPDHYFPLYGFGRTLLSDGRYVEAAETIQKAIEYGAQDVVRFDLGEALYRAGQMDEAHRTLRAALDAIREEPHRLLMAHYLLWRSDEYDPPMQTLIDSGLPYWMETAGRFAHTPYGAALRQDIEQIGMLREEA